MGTQKASSGIPALQAAVRQAWSTYSTTHSLADLERCIDAFRRFISADTKAEHGTAVIVYLADLLGERWVLTRSDDHWSEAVRSIAMFRERLPRSDWREPLYVLAHGVLLYRRASATQAPEDVADAICGLAEARGMVRPDSFVGVASSTYMANLRLRRFEANHDPLDLEAALQDSLAVLTSSRALKPQTIQATKTFARAATLRAEVGQAEGHVDFAIESVRRALELTKEPEERGDLRSVLGSLLRQRFRRDANRADIDAAIEAYRADLEEPGLPDVLRAARSDNLGNGFADRYEFLGDTADLDAAIECSRKALSLFPSNSPARALAYANLGRFLVARWRERRDPDVLTEALDTMKAGLSINDAATSVVALLNGTLLEACLLSDFSSGKDEHLDEAVVAGEAAVKAFTSSEADEPVLYRLAARGRSESIIRRLVGALLHRASRRSASSDSDLRRALSLGETGKVPLLVRELLRRSLPPPDGVDGGKIFWEKQVLAQLAALDVHEMAPAENLRQARRLRRIEQRRNARLALERVWEEIEASGSSGRQYVAVRRDLSAALDNSLQRRPPGWLVLSVLDTEELAPDGRWQHRFSVLALRPGHVHPEVLCAGPGKLLSVAQDLFFKEVLESAETYPREETWWEELGSLFRGKQGDPDAQIVLSATSDGLNLPWQLLFERSGWLDTDGMTPPTVVVPSLVLTATAGSSGDNEWHELKNALEHLGIADEHGLADNLRVLQRFGSTPTTGALVVGDPSRDLESASDETSIVAQVLHVKPLLGLEANIEAVRAGFQVARIVHIAAHASFNTDNPLDSVLHLADGDLSARDLIGSWSTSELVVLSACESGTGAPILGGEVLGLATELLRSGVQAVVASIWPIDDAATAYLMKQFHRRRLSGLATSRALAKAMSATKGQPGWSRPYYWAGFVLVQRGLAN